jgi:hypothetical protein
LFVFLFVLVHQREEDFDAEKDNLHLQVNVLNDQLDHQVARISDLEQLLASKTDLLRKSEAALDREQSQNQTEPNLLILQSDLAQVRNRCTNLERENIELRRLLGGDRTPKYLPLSPQIAPPASPLILTPEAETASPDHGHHESRTPRGFKKFFGKIKRSNSGGHLTQDQSPNQPRISPKRSFEVEQQPPAFRRGGLRATAGGRLVFPRHWKYHLFFDIISYHLPNK